VDDVLVATGRRTAADLRLATQDIHLATESNPFIVALMGGHLGIHDLARLTGQLRSVYAAVESAVRPHRQDQILGALFDPRLDRVGAIDADLRRLAGDEAARLTEQLPATVDYVARIHEVRHDGPRLTAHHYVRYLGDLSGGQVIATLMRRHYQAPDDALTFYAFDGLGSKGGFKAGYRKALDRLFEDHGTFDAVVDEARLAYDCNRRLFEALGEGQA
jgi:heme oxygenase